MANRKIFFSPSLFTLLSLFLISTVLLANDSNGHISILSANELLKIKDSVTLLDARSKMSFRQGRIPGSQQVDWRDWAKERGDVIGLWFGKTAQSGLSRNVDDDMQNELRKLGISNSKKVVIVGEPKGWGEEARVAWDLLYWGVEDVALLDGGFKSWVAIKGPVETGPVVRPDKGDFIFHLRLERRARWSDVKKAVDDKSSTIIDNRSKEEFDGKKIMGQKRGGHIPGAISLPASTLYQSDGTYQKAEQLAALLSLGENSDPIAYCVGGVRSALFAMIWEARFGKIISNYDGSIWEWSADPDLPLER